MTEIVCTVTRIVGMVEDYVTDRIIAFYHT